MRSNRLIQLCLCGLLTACAGSRYHYADDHAPADIPQLNEVADAVPLKVEYSRYGNRDYTVRGVNYKIWRDINELKQSGKASWYGKKFHGHKTSNGEIYDMFSMSAAHKNLPLPSFVRVTNRANNKSVVVRVNDRGPFHQDRIIDLSYAAAYRLDMLQSGTAEVDIELIMPQEQPVQLLSNEKQWFIQILASSNRQKAQQIGQDLTDKYHQNNRLTSNGKLYRLQLGPINDHDEADQLLKKIRQSYPNAYLFEELFTGKASNKSINNKT